MDQEEFKAEEVVFSGFLGGIISIVLGVYVSPWWWLACVVCFAVAIYHVIKLRRTRSTVNPRYMRDDPERFPDLDEEPGLFNTGIGKTHHGAIDDAVYAASPGKRIAVEPGTYDGPMMIDKPLTIEAEGNRNETVVHPGSGWLIMCDGVVTIRGLKFEVDEDHLDAVEVSEGKLILDRCHVHGRILVRKNTGEAEFTNCRFTGKNGGIQFSESGSGRVTKCEFFKVGGPAVASYRGGRAGLYDCTLSPDTFTAVDVREHARLDIAGCKITGGLGVIVAEDAEVSMSDSRVANSTANGMVCNSSSRLELNDCEVLGSAQAGIVVDGASMTIIGGSVTDNKGAGIAVRNSASVYARGCDVFNNAENWEVEDGCTVDHEEGLDEC